MCFSWLAGLWVIGVLRVVRVWVEAGGFAPSHSVMYSIRIENESNKWDVEEKNNGNTRAGESISQVDGV